MHATGSRRPCSGATRRIPCARSSIARRRSPMADEVLSARDGAVLTITLNRPEVYNAINRAMHEALAGALREAAGPAVRAVVLTGAGRGFCAGQDLREFGSLPGGVREALE